MDLAKVQKPIDRQRSVTDNRDAILPQRRDTQAPDLQVNAPIDGAGGSNAADVLRQTLGIVNNAADSVAGYADARQKKINEQDAGAGSVDAATGKKDEQKFAKSQAYRKAYAVENAQNLAFTTDQAVTDAVEARLRDEDHPADLADIQKIVDDAFASVAMDGGKPKDFGHPEAQRVLAEQMTRTRIRIMSAAHDVIKTREDSKLVSTVGDNVFHEIVQARGAPAPQPGDQPAPAPTSAPTGQLPVTGPITSAFGLRTAPTAGASTDHKGVDIGAALGTPVTLPAAGTVVATGSGGKRGNWIEVDHGDGVVTRYFHLSKIGVKKGDTVDAGAVIGNVGQTGNATGPHLHYSVLKDGKAVDPTAFTFASAYLTVPAAATAQVAVPASEKPPVIPFEEAMSRVPPTVDRATAKKGLLQSFINAADKQGDPSILDGLENSTRKDGTPSFTPAEVAVILQERQQIADRVRTETDRKRKELWDNTADAVYKDWLNTGAPPSRAKLAGLVNTGKMDPSMAFTIQNHVEAEQRQEAAENRMEARQAQADADATDDLHVSGLREARLAGDLRGTSYEEDLQRLRSGELGQGKRAVARFNILRNAARAGTDAAMQNPETKMYGEQLREHFLPKLTRQSRVAMALGGSQKMDRANGVGALAYYRDQIAKGERPSSAFLATMAKFDKGAEGDKARNYRLQQLRQRAAAGR